MTNFFSVSHPATIVLPLYLISDGGQGIYNLFKIVSLNILILKKQQFSKPRKVDQSYPVGAIKVTPKL